MHVCVPRDLIMVLPLIAIFRFFKRTLNDLFAQSKAAVKNLMYEYVERRGDYESKNLTARKLLIIFEILYNIYSTRAE